MPINTDTTAARLPWYRITTSEKNDEATIMLYDPIGDYYEIDDESYGWRNIGVKDIEFVKEIERLDEKYGTIHVRINSPGGDIGHGAAIVNAILRCKAEVHTWNDGIAASMAAIIWAAGKKRHMAANATLMFHSGLWVCVGNPQDMRDCAETLDKMNDAMIAGMAQTLDMTADDIRAAWFADYKDHWLTHADATAAGLINAGVDYRITDDNPAQALHGKTYRELVAHFQATQHPEALSWLDQLRAAFTNALSAFTHHTAPLAAPSAQGDTNHTLDMTIDEFKKAIADGTLPIADAQAHLATLNPDPAKADPAKADPPAPVADVAAELAALRADLNAAQEAIAAFGARPGAGKSDPQRPGDDLPDPGKTPTTAERLAEANKAYAAAAERGEALKVTLQ